MNKVLSVLRLDGIRVALPVILPAAGLVLSSLLVVAPMASMALPFSDCTSGDCAEPPSISCQDALKSTDSAADDALDGVDVSNIDGLEAEVDFTPRDSVGNYVPMVSAKDVIRSVENTRSPLGKKVVYLKWKSTLLRQWLEARMNDGRVVRLRDDNRYWRNDLVDKVDGTIKNRVFKAHNTIQLHTSYSDDEARSEFYKLVAWYRDTGFDLVSHRRNIVSAAPRTLKELCLTAMDALHAEEARLQFTAIHAMRWHDTGNNPESFSTQWRKISTIKIVLDELSHERMAFTSAYNNLVTR